MLFRIRVTCSASSSISRRRQVPGPGLTGPRFQRRGQVHPERGRRIGNGKALCRFTCAARYEQRTLHRQVRVRPRSPSHLLEPLMPSVPANLPKPLSAYVGLLASTAESARMAVRQGPVGAARLPLLAITQVLSSRERYDELAERGEILLQRL